MSSFTDKFEQTRSDVIDWEGHAVRPLLRFPVRPGATVRVRRLGSSPVRAQAIKLGLDRGNLAVNGLRSPSVALWTHTAPVDVELTVDGPAKVLDVWNAWSLDGVDNSWMGNAGIIVEEHANGYTLQCSDGVDGPDFSDLIVWVGIQD